MGEGVLVERQIGDQALQPAGILVLARPELRSSLIPRRGAFLLPNVERRFGHAHLPTDIRWRRAALHVPEHVRNLPFGELRLLHGPRSLVKDV